jgi:maleate isomerase
MTMRRIGLLLPSSNTVMEPDFARAFAGRATIHAARMHLGDPVTREGELRLLDDYAKPAARDIGTLEPDVVVFGCTSAGSLRGAEGDATLRARLSGLAGAPVLGILDAMGTALRRREVRRVSVLTPYVDDLNGPIVDSLRAQGFEVARITGLGTARNIDIGRIDPSPIIAAAASAAAPDSDALAVACTNFRALEVLGDIAERSGTQVVTATSAAIELASEALDELD